MLSRTALYESPARVTLSARRSVPARTPRQTPSRLGTAAGGAGGCCSGSGGGGGAGGVAGPRTAHETSHATVQPNEVRITPGYATRGPRSSSNALRAIPAGEEDSSRHPHDEHEGRGRTTA